MSRQLAPRILPGGEGQEVSPLLQKPRKITTACGACKQRKTKCNGGNPCDACSARDTACAYDASTDQRRKIANQRNVQQLANTRLDLEKHQQLLGGIIATLRAGDARSQEDLRRFIQNRTDLSQLAAYVRNECRSHPDIQQAYGEINFVIDGEESLPSPTQILGQVPGPSSMSVRADSQEIHSSNIDPSISLSMYDTDED